MGMGWTCGGGGVQSSMGSGGWLGGKDERQAECGGGVCHSRGRVPPRGAGRRSRTRKAMRPTVCMSHVNMQTCVSPAKQPYATCSTSSACSWCACGVVAPAAPAATA